MQYLNFFCTIWSYLFWIVHWALGFFIFFKNLLQSTVHIWFKSYKKTLVWKKLTCFLTEPTYPYPEHIVYEYRFPNENRIERWPLDQCTRYPNSAESNSPPLLWESAGSSPEYLMNSAAAPRSSRLANIYFSSNKLSGS